METSAFLSPRPDSNYAENSFQSDESFSTVGGLNTFGTPEARTQIELDSPTHRGESSSSSVRPRPSILDTTAAQDGSLPSPSLSPVTAAAHLQSRKGYFDDLQINTNPPHEYGREMSLWKDEAEALASRSSLNQGLDFRNQGPSSMMEIPGMLDAFETMPSEMKSYFMYQLLRRCPKPVLHFVADSVNPALKCDFLNLLPLELCQNVIGHLDLKSLCRAAQVSKKWQRIIDTDEKTWKNLFDAEGYDLSPGELKRAIAEGWGWQHGSDLGGFEKDLSNLNPENNTGKRSSPSGDSSELSHCASPTPEAGPQSSRRSKRKAATKSRAVSRKTQKKKDIPSNEDALFDNESLKKHIANTEGPYAAAQAALAAIPNSNIGLPSLRSLRLYKSIYRRHHLISKNWMQDVIKPRHLAFKAHQRHVVTCLQFDSDKILTGSDDTNINVYDTRTGAKRETLQGHEGGVWALQYEGNTLVSGSTDRSVRVWDIEKGKCTHVFQGHTSTVRCLVILMPAVVGKRSDGVSIMMPEEPLIITGSRDSTLRIWKLPKPGDTPLSPNGPAQDDADSPYFVRVFTGHIHSVRAIAAYGDTLVSGSYDCTVRVWKISTGETLHRLQGHAQKVYSVVLDHERNRCISGSMDNMVKVWSLDTGTVLHNLEGHSSLVGLLDLQRNYLVSAAADSTLRIWDPENGQCKSILSAHTGAITCFQHDGRKVISGSDRNLKMWNIKTGGFVRDLLTDLSGVWQVKFDEQRCVAAVQRSGLTYIEVCQH